jgi:hypothetical protein
MTGLSSERPIVEVTETARLAQILDAGDGFIYNAYPSRDPGLSLIHHVSCRHARRMMPRTDREVLLFSKLWSDDFETLRQEVAREGRPHGLCPDEDWPAPGGPERVAGRHPSTRSIRASASATAPAPVEDYRYELRDDDSTVEFWSSFRASWAPKGIRGEAQRALGASLRKMHVPGASTLYARYTATDRALADLENVTIYNIDPLSFRGMDVSTIVIERSFDAPAPAPSGVATGYHLIYELRTDIRARQWKDAGDFFVFTGVVLPGPDVPKRAAPVWWGVRHAASITTGATADITGAFGLELNLTLGPGRVGPAEMVKPLFDGVVAAAVRDSTAGARVDVGELAAQIGQPLPAVLAHLNDHEHTPLGDYRLMVRCATLQMSPPDDLCVCATLTVRRSPTAQRAELAGRLFSVEPRS